jgi:hypothetical protein
MELFDVAANAKVADIAKVPEDFRFFYKQDGENGFVLDQENPINKSALSIFTGLKTALTRARGDLKKAEGQKVDLTALNEFGTTPDEIAAKFKTVKEGLEGQIKNVNVGKIKEGIEQEWKPKLETSERKNKVLQEQLYNVLVNGETLRALSGHTDSPELAIPFIQKQVKVLEVEGELQVVVVDSNGETRYSGTNPMSIADLVKEMKANTKYGRLFNSEAGAGGGGTKPGTTKMSAAQAAAAAAQGRTENLSSLQKISAGLKQAGHKVA